MGTTLTGTTPQDTYDSLIKVTDNGPLSGSLKTLTDGLGNDSALALSTGAARVTGTLAVTTGTISGTDAIAISAVNTNTNGTTFALNSAGTVGIMTFLTASTERMRITSAGNVGIGTSSPAQKLDVNGSVRANGGSYDPTTSAWVNAAFTTAVSASPYGGGVSIIDGTAGWTQYGIGSGANLVFAYGTTSGGTTPYLTLNNSGYLRLAAGGIQFNGDTAAANALDDYEEGTFTPTAYGATSAGTTTYNNQNGYYTKIGRMVNVSFFVSYSALTGTGSLLLGGLPFAISNSTQNYPIGSLVADGLNWTGGTYLQAIGLQGETNIAINYIADDASVANQQCVNEAASLRINLTYFV